MRIHILPLLLVFFMVFAFSDRSFASGAEKVAAGNEVQMRIVGFCSSCHGSNGVSVGETIPSIGGQTKDYLIISMMEMKEKTRRATLMHKIAVGYNHKEIVAIADYFSKITWKQSENKLNPKLAAKGKALSSKCADCHTDNGKGSGEIPRIAGQNAKYLYNALIEYKDKVRNNDAGGAMMADAANLLNEDLNALAEYYSSVK